MVKVPKSAAMPMMTFLLVAGSQPVGGSVFFDVEEDDPGPLADADVDVREGDPVGNGTGTSPVDVDVREGGPGGTGTGMGFVDVEDDFGDPRTGMGLSDEEDDSGGLGTVTSLLDVVDEDLGVLFLDVNEDLEVLSSEVVEVLSSEVVEDVEVFSSEVVEDLEVLFLGHLLEVRDRLDVTEGLGRHVGRRAGTDDSVLELRVFPARGPKKESLLICGENTGEAASSENGIGVLLDKLCADEGMPGSSLNTVSSSLSSSPHKDMPISCWRFEWSFSR